MNSNIAKFFIIYKGNILSEFNFSPLLRFNSGKGYQKLVYRVSDWLELEEWAPVQDFLTSMGEFAVIDNLIHEYHDNACNFLKRYQNIAFNKNRQIIENVLCTLQGFVTKYEAIGLNGFLPVSRSYLEAKLRDAKDAYS
jgi:hypothetical protein